MDPLEQRAQKAGVDLANPFYRLPLLTRLGQLGREAYHDQDLAAFTGILRSMVRSSDEFHGPNPVLRATVRLLIRRPDWLSGSIQAVDPELESTSFGPLLFSELANRAAESSRNRRWSEFWSLYDSLKALVEKRPQVDQFQRLSRVFDGCGLASPEEQTRMLAECRRLRLAGHGHSPLYSAALQRKLSQDVSAEERAWLEEELEAVG